MTDVKLVKDYDTNEFRGFAFVGFRDPEDGTEAINNHNGTYIGTAKVMVELAKSTTDPTIRPWS